MRKNHYHSSCKAKCQKVSSAPHTHPSQALHQPSREQCCNPHQGLREETLILTDSEHQPALLAQPCLGHALLCISVCVYSCEHVCGCVCMCVRVYVHTHAGLLMWGEGLCREAWCWIHAPCAPPQVTPQPPGPGSPFLGGEEPSDPVRQAASKDKVRAPCTPRSRCVNFETETRVG